MRLTVFLIAAVPFVVLAKEVQAYEFRLIPHYLGYSNYGGVLAGGALSVAADVSEQWQWELGAFGGIGTKWRSADFSVFTGPRFNIGEDRSNAFFVGFGVEYGDRVKCCDKSGLSAYAEMGKRFSLNASKTWTYAPSVKFWADETTGVLSFHPATFTYFF